MSAAVARTWSMVITASCRPWSMSARQALSNASSASPSAITPMAGLVVGVGGGDVSAESGQAAVAADSDRRRTTAWTMGQNDPSSHRRRGSMISTARRASCAMSSAVAERSSQAVTRRRHQRSARSRTIPISWVIASRSPRWASSITSAKPELVSVVVHTAELNAVVTVRSRGRNWSEISGGLHQGK
ncbi:hypothetical protein [Actinokineospora sp.]|uniref:hypothetical protein n=1 Tax=Actinokineospora sp. TaxID=1872133 RepID=UPI003D6A906C